VSRDGERDQMVLHVEPANGSALDGQVVEASLRDVTKLGGAVALAAVGTLPNDGKVIADERDYSR
jgi:phenylacetate-CoA ligase